MDMKVAVQAIVAGLLYICIAAPWAMSATGQGDSRYFPETRHTVKGIFLKYWNEHGGLPQQGYPISEEFTEVSDLDGKPYTVQYFERAVFEKHPENKPPYDVLLSQLGTFQYRAKYGETGAPDQKPNSQNSQLFKETGFQVGGPFLEYWKTHGGLAQQGYPISNEFSEVSDLDGKTYTVQYFERAVFELHPENKPPYDVLLSQLGTFQMRKKYPNGAPGGEGQPQPTQPAAQPTRTASAGQPTRTPGGTNCEPVAESKKSSISSAGPIEIADVQYEGTEHVTLRNKSAATVDVSGWVLRDKNDPQQRFAFPGGTQIPAGGTVQVYTEPGHPYSFNSRSSIWNNCGDALELVNAQGAVVATYAYGTHKLP
jgi:hypothetical protein